MLYAFLHKVFIVNCSKHLCKRCVEHTKMPLSMLDIFRAEVLQLPCRCCPSCVTLGETQDLYSQELFQNKMITSQSIPATKFSGGWEILCPE